MISRVPMLCVLVCTELACSGKGLVPAIAGDWFLCTAPSCTYLTWEGTRYAEDGTFTLLVAPGDALEEPERYCEDAKDHLRGRYSYDGQTVTETSLSGVTSSYEMAITDENKGIARVRLLDRDPQTGDGRWVTYYELRIAPTRSYGVCPAIREFCSPVTCPTGCCANDACKHGVSQSDCGSGGTPCAVCPADKLCVDHQCK